MRVSFRLADGVLDLAAPDARLEGRRPVGEADVRRFEDWAATYRTLAGREGRQGKLLALGGELYGWLDGGERWLTTLLDRAQPPLVVEFQVRDANDAAAAAFLRAPWELLARDGAHLAADVALRFCPLRRLGAAGAPAPPSDFRLGLTFMAAAPRGEHELEFEAEETAILDATGTIGLDLTVEESGNPDRLAERLAELDEIQVLHLSCHGTSEPTPLLLLEDEEGGRLLTDAAALIETLQNNLPRLLFLSACQSAAAGALADPLVTTMIRAGLPAALGWDGSVYDREATAFAAELYENLVRRGTLEEAVGAARRALLNTEGPRPSRDWHLARLWLGPGGGGRLLSGRNRKRWMLSPDHGFKEFLDARGQRSPVAGRDAFVGRRRELQTALRVLRAGERAGVLIHGMGRLGKSSLAARIAHRRPDLAPAVVFERYDALSVLDAIEGACPQAASLIAEGRGALRDAPERLEGLLRSVLEGPCQQAGDGRPVLLVIDDLEQILEDPAPGGRHRVQAGYVPVLRAVLRAFDPGRTDSRLLLTSRFTFTLPDRGDELADRLHSLQLPPMDATAARKQALRREQAHGATPADDAGKAQRRQELLARAVAVARGNPGLQDRLFDLVFEAPDEAARALDEMEAYLARGDLPEQEAVRAFLENLTIEHLVGLLSDGERALLRAAILFELPVPLEVLEKLRAAVGGDVGRLLALGLCDRFEDVVAPPRPAATVNALTRPRAGELSEGDARVLTGLVLDELFGLWGGADGRGRPHPADAELTRLALLSENAPVLAACAAPALYWLHRQLEYRRAADWAQRSLAIVDGAGIEPATHLLWWVGVARAEVDELASARVYYDRALAQIDAQRAAGVPVNENVWGGLLLAQGRLLAKQYERDRAIGLFQQAQELAVKAGDERNAAVVLSEIARLRAARGEVEEALRLHSEQVEIFERLGDPRARAVALGDIARLRAARGDIDGAFRLHREQVKTFKHLGDVRERARALVDIAGLWAERHKVNGALRLLTKVSEVLECLDDVRERARALGDIAWLRAKRGEVDEARRLQTERLDTYRELGDLEGEANALWSMAQIERFWGDNAEAVSMVEEAYGIFDRTGSQDGICEIGLDMGQILVARGEREEGLAVLRRSEAGFRQMRRDGEAEQVAELIRQIEAGG